MKKEPNTLRELIAPAYSGDDGYAIVMPELARELGIDTDQLEIVTFEDDGDDEQTNA